MFTKSVQTILARAMSEPQFAEKLFTNPHQALSSYRLTPDEIILFEGMSRAEFKAMAAEERKSFGVRIPDVRGGDSIETLNHNQTTLKMRKGIEDMNHNQPILKAK